MSKPVKKEWVLDLIGAVLMDVFVLVGIISVFPYAADDLVGTIAVMLVLAALGVAYTVAVIGDYRKNAPETR